MGKPTMNSIKWGLITFMSSITCATIAHYVPEPGAIFSVLFACGFAMFGGFAVATEQREGL